jgi:ABC-type lipoprotein export system ATPase subunit
VLSLEHVSKCYWRRARRIEALRDVSLELEPGDFVAVHGTMRAGKTTLLRIAAGIERPDSGTARYRGMDLAQMRPGELAHYMRAEVGCAGLWKMPAGSLRVLDYVALPLFAERQARRAAQRRAYEVLELVGVESSGDRPVIELSDGERRRIELAQALVRRPKVLLADEPVSGADVNYVEGDQILELLQSVARDMSCAVMITSPEASAAMRATRIIGLDRGRLISGRQKPQGEIVEFPKTRLAQRQAP